MEHKYRETYGALQEPCFVMEGGRVVQKTYADFIDALRIRYWQGEKDFHWHVCAVDVWYGGISAGAPDIGKAKTEGVDVGEASRYRIYATKEEAGEDGAVLVRLYCTARYTLTGGRKLYAFFLTPEAAARHLADEWKKEIEIWADAEFVSQERARALLLKAA